MSTLPAAAALVVSDALDQLAADHASVTLIRRGRRLETVAPSDEVARTLDQLQHDLDEGICRDSAWDGSTLWSSDLAADPRWPRWGPRAAQLGVRSMLAVGLTAEDGRRRGSLNVFWDGQRQLSDDEVAYGVLFCRWATLTLTSGLAAQNLTAALDSRTRVGQAQGILMARYDLGEAAAFDLLRHYSQDHNVKLREVAEQVVTTRALPGRTTTPAAGRGA